jgi:hypothetical protein
MEKRSNEPAVTTRVRPPFVRGSPAVPLAADAASRCSAHPPKSRLRAVDLPRTTPAQHQKRAGVVRGRRVGGAAKNPLRCRSVVKAMHVRKAEVDRGKSKQAASRPRCPLVDKSPRAEADVLPRRWKVVASGGRTLTNRSEEEPLLLTCRDHSFRSRVDRARAQFVLASRHDHCLCARRRRPAPGEGDRRPRAALSSHATSTV